MGTPGEVQTMPLQPKDAGANPMPAEGPRVKHLERDADQESPDYVMTSLAGAIALGLEPGRFGREEVELKGLNLLMTYRENCVANCTYCGMARERRLERDETTFIRVKWPVYHVEELIARTVNRSHHLRRLCVGMLAQPKSLEHSLTVIRMFRQRTNLLISGLITASLIKSRAQLEQIREAGADRVDIAIDAATEELFTRHRGRPVGGPHRWDHFWWVTEEATRVFPPGTVGIHLVVGLGETEEELLGAVQRAQDLGVVTHLFSFNPEPRTQLGDWPQPPRGQYRRVQLGRYLINELGMHRGQFGFNGRGQVIDFGLPEAVLERIVQSGRPFMTSGCPDETGETACNRPYSNERPSQPIRNFAFIPTVSDLAEIRRQLADYGEGSPSEP